MNKSYQIPTDQNSCCYSSKTEVLETPSSLPDDLKQWTSLSLENYSDIVKKCNDHFNKKSKISLIFLLVLVAIAVAVILFATKPFSPTFAAIILAGSLFIIIITYFILLIKVLRRFDKVIDKLNDLYSCKGIKVQSQGVVVGSGKNRKTITRIFIDYSEDWNKQPKQLETNNLQKAQHQEIELTSINPSSNQTQSYYIAPIPPPSNNDTISLCKEDDFLNNNK